LLIEEYSKVVMLRTSKLLGQQTRIHLFFSEQFYKNTRLIFAHDLRKIEEQSQPRQNNKISYFQLK